MSKTEAGAVPVWKRILFSEVILSKSHAQKIAYIGLMAALCMVSNMFFEFKMFDVQFSATLFFSMLTGILIGPALGFVAAFLGDLIGFFYNSWGMMYMPWVGLSVATAALITGLVMKLPFGFRGAGYAKLSLACVLVLVFCTVGINTTGLYYYYVGIGAFSEKAMTYMTETLGTGATYWAYTLFRLFFSGQIYNNLFNYVLLFLAVPLLNAAKPLKIRIK